MNYLEVTEVNSFRDYAAEIEDLLLLLLILNVRDKEI
jgi:hypothetical protein